MGEQFEFNFDDPENLEKMTDEELAAKYKEVIGVSPRTTNRDEIIEGIMSPEEERSKLREHDIEEDRDDLRNTNRRW